MFTRKSRGPPKKRRRTSLTAKAVAAGPHFCTRCACGCLDETWHPSATTQVKHVTRLAPLQSLAAWPRATNPNQARLAASRQYVQANRNTCLTYAGCFHDVADACSLAKRNKHALRGILASSPHRAWLFVDDLLSLNLALHRGSVRDCRLIFTDIIVAKHRLMQFGCVGAQKSASASIAS